MAPAGPPGRRPGVQGGPGGPVGPPGKARTFIFHVTFVTLRYIPSTVPRLWPRTWRGDTGFCEKNAASSGEPPAPPGPPWTPGLRPGGPDRSNLQPLAVNSNRFARSASPGEGFERSVLVCGVWRVVCGVWWVVRGMWWVVHVGIVKTLNVEYARACVCRALRGDLRVSHRTTLEECAASGSWHPAHGQPNERGS